MTPSLDTCLASIYEPGFIPADSGVPPTVPVFTLVYNIEVLFRGNGTLSVNTEKAGTQEASATFNGLGVLRVDTLNINARIGEARFNGAGSLSAMWNAFTPAQVSGLQIWFKGDTLSGSDGDAITTWADQSGNGRDATQTTAANKPLLETAELNGLNVVHFDPATTERWMELTSLGGTGWTEGTIICVLKAGADPGSGTRGGPHYFGTAGTTNHYPYSDNNIYNGDMTNTRKTVGNPASTVAAWRIVGTRSATNDWKYYLDGVQFFTTATNTVAFGTSRLGAGGASVGFKFDGFIAEWMLFNVAITQSNREKIEGYLAWKWGITANLDVSHPYKTSPP